jgi:predicted Zn-dependent protease
LLTYAAFEVAESSPERAAALLRRALKQSPRSADVLAFYASARSLTGALEPDVERMYREALEWDQGQPMAAMNLAQLLLRRDEKDDEARQLLLDIPPTRLTPALKLEVLFYAVAYRLPGLGDPAAEMRSMVAAVVRIPPWNLADEVARAKAENHPDVDLLAQALV